MKEKDITGHFTTKGKKIKISKGGPLGMGKLGFIAPELAQFVYAAITVLLILFTWTSIKEPSALLFQRVSFLSGTLALWVVYQIWPCKFMMLCRLLYLLVMLGSWYPDTYEINQQFGSYDHLFAQWEQSLFGCQPAALFSQKFSSAIVSELMYMGYVSYYLFFVVTVIVVYFRSYQQLERVSFIIFASFFLCYVIYLVLPVTGPQYYFYAVGMDDIMVGKLPDIGHYFSETTECLKAPGWQDGLFYNVCQLAHQSGERPTAAFPSSHVAIATLVMVIVARMRMWKYMLLLAVPYLFLCMATVYIQAHYVVDAIVGFFVGIALFFLFGGMKLRRA